MAERVQHPVVRGAGQEHGAEPEDGAHQQQVRGQAGHLQDGHGHRGAGERQAAADEVAGVHGDGAEAARGDPVGGGRGELRHRRRDQRERPPAAPRSAIAEKT
ncbi:hypothetical protein [Actinomadura madurae]|uniref:hypothetical protein n=1 Tax=Actinomadura madurae TaxID=1993 RepID=UPI0035583F68